LAAFEGSHAEGQADPEAKKGVLHFIDHAPATFLLPCHPDIHFDGFGHEVGRTDDPRQLLLLDKPVPVIIWRLKLSSKLLGWLKEHA